MSLFENRSVRSGYSRRLWNRDARTFTRGYTEFGEESISPIKLHPMLSFFAAGDEDEIKSQSQIQGPVGEKDDDNRTIS